MVASIFARERTMPGLRGGASRRSPSSELPFPDRTRKTPCEMTHASAGSSATTGRPETVEHELLPERAAVMLRDAPFLVVIRTHLRIVVSLENNEQWFS